MKTKYEVHIGWVYTYVCIDESSKYYGYKYVGQTRQTGGVNQRDCVHKNSNKTPFDRIYSKHPDSFKLMGEEEFLATSEEELIEMLNEYESRLISRYDCIIDNGHGLNSTYGGESCVVSEETRKKQSEVMKKVYSSPEARQMRSERSKKMWANPEHRQKISEVYSTPDAKKKRSDASAKRWANSEHRQKWSEAIKKALSSPEYRQKVSERSKKTLSNPAVRQKLSNSVKKAYSSPEARQMCSERMKKALSNPDIRKKWLRPCHIFDLETGFYFQFCSCTEAQKFIGMSKNKLSLYTSKPYKKRYIFVP